VLQFPGGVTFSVDVAEFLELQCAFERQQSEDIVKLVLRPSLGNRALPEKRGTMLWNLDLKGVVVLARNIAGIGVIPAVLNVVGVLLTIVTIIGADDPQTEANKIADRIVTAAVSAIV
jgi:hypothetical protein